MGKVKKHRKGAEVRKDSTLMGSRNSPVKLNVETESLRIQKILPVVKNLSSGSVGERNNALDAVCILLEDDTCRFLFLKERIVQKLMEDLLHDPAENIVVLSWKALRIIAEKEGYDQCLNIFRRGILSRITRTLELLSVSIEPTCTSGIKSKEIMWTCVDDIAVLLTCLSNTSENILDEITALSGVVPFLMGLLKSASNSSDNTKAIAAQCLSSLTEDNDDLTKVILESPDYVSCILQLKDSRIPLIRICICGVIHNLSLGPCETETEVSDALILPTVTKFIKHIASVDLNSYSTQTTTNEDQSGIKAIEISLEIVASIATALGYELEGGLNSEESLLEFTEGDASETDREMDENEDCMHEDSEMLTDNSKAENIGSNSPESIVKYLLEITAPAVILLSKLLLNSLIVVRLRALAALNNIAWTADAAVLKMARFSKKWRANCNTIWDSVITPVLVTNTADSELADAITGVAWAVVKNTEGNVDLRHAQHKSFIGLYLATNTDGLRSKCVGVLGCLAMRQDMIEINKEIGVFLLGLITNAPETPADATVEALNAIFDIYSDAEFAYDEPTFVQNGFIKYLEDSTPKIRATVRRIDKRKFPELRQRADEAAMNLTRFIQYKKKERFRK